MEYTSFNNLVNVGLYNRLVVVEDLVNIRDVHSGFLVVRRGAFIFNDKLYDLVTKHLSVKAEKLGFYNVPIVMGDCHLPSLLTDVEKRFMFKSPLQEPRLVDVMDSRMVSSSYFKTSTQKIGDSERFRKRIDAILFEFDGD